ncbi:hypothetical protein JCM39194_25470 [Desulfotomaculum varum]
MYKMMRDKKGEVIGFVVFFLPIIIFLINFTLTYAAYQISGSVVVTAAREGARTYAVKDDAGLAKSAAENVIKKSLNDKIEYFNPSHDVQLSQDGNYRVCKVSYRMPVPMPAMFKLIGVNTVMGKYLVATSTARFVLEKS